MARKIAWMLVALVLGLGVFGMVSAQAKGPPQPTGVTYLDHTVHSGFSDLGKHGFSPGDEFFFHDALKQGGTKKGTIDGYCKVIQLKPVGTAVCTATVKIGSAQLEVQTGGSNILAEISRCDLEAGFQEGSEDF